MKIAAVATAFLLTACGSQSPTPMTQAAPSGEGVSVGRYQLVSVQEIGNMYRIFLLDTVTSKVWQPCGKERVSWCEMERLDLPVSPAAQESEKIGPGKRAPRVPPGLFTVPE